MVNGAETLIFRCGRKDTNVIDEAGRSDESGCNQAHLAGW
jgi:hypothetical protein